MGLIFRLSQLNDFFARAKILNISTQQQALILKYFLLSTNIVHKYAYLLTIKDDVLSNYITLRSIQ